LIARDCKLPEAEDVSSRLRGREVTFYKNVWLGQIELAEGDRYYFLTRPSGRKGRLIPISNAIGAVDRANRQYALNLTRENIADYLNFYYAFTPKEDPMLSRMPGGGGPSQLAVPRSIDDLEIEDSDRAAAASEKSGCSDECLVSGAVWHFLDGDSHHRVVPLRYRRRINVSGRIPVQFRHAVFAVDFRVPQDTGVPILSHEELLFQSNALREPTFPGAACLSIPKRIKRFELWQNLRDWLSWLTTKIGRGASGVAWILFALAMLYFWGCAALFSVGNGWIGKARRTNSSCGHRTSANPIGHSSPTGGRALPSSPSCGVSCSLRIATRSSIGSSACVRARSSLGSSAASITS
jgi:hypothetical protein